MLPDPVTHVSPALTAVRVACTMEQCGIDCYSFISRIDPGAQWKNEENNGYS